MHSRTHCRIEGLEPRRLLADVADANWSGGQNETIATAQGPTAIVDQATSTYRIEGAVGAPTDLADYFALRPSVAGTLSIRQTGWLSGATPDWRLLNASGTEIARKSTGTTAVSVAASPTIYLYVIGGATANQYYSWDVSLAKSTTPPPTTDLGGVPSQRLARLGKGITIGRWFWTPQNVTPFSTTGSTSFLADSEIAALYKSGIRNLRLLVGPEWLFSSTGATQGDYDSAYRVFRDGNQRQEWYTSSVPASGASLAVLQAKWDAIKAAVRRISAVSNAAKTSTNDSDMIVTLVPYEVAKTLEFGPYGSDSREPFRTNRFDNFANWWKAFSGRLLSGSDALTPEQVAFELMNEPSFFGQNAYWRDQQRKLIGAVRANDSAARYTIIASAPAGRADAVGDVRGLIAFDIDAADKGNVVYNCKFYEPGDIASQGADNLRTSDPSYVGWLHSLPWPSASAASSIIPGYRYGTPYNSTVAGYSTFLSYYNKYPWFQQDGARTPQQVADSVFAYSYGIDASEPIPGYSAGSGFNAAYLTGRTQQIAAWRTREQVPVLITEVGANASYAAYANATSYGDGVNNDVRSGYLRDVKAAFDTQSLGWVLWGYDDANAFGVAKATNITGTTRASRQVPLTTLASTGRLISNADGTFNLTRVDRDVLAAFGLNTNVTATTFARTATVLAASMPTSTPKKRSGASSAADLFGTASIL
jgi:hypothetical protein